LEPDALFVWGRRDTLVPIAFERHVAEAARGTPSRARLRSRAADRNAAPDPRGRRRVLRAVRRQPAGTRTHRLSAAVCARVSGRGAGPIRGPGVHVGPVFRVGSRARAPVAPRGAGAGGGRAGSGGAGGGDAGSAGSASIRCAREHPLPPASSGGAPRRAGPRGAPPTRRAGCLSSPFSSRSASAPRRSRLTAAVRGHEPAVGR
jgi:hypothetical protein